MKHAAVLRFTVDVLMTLCLMFLTGYQIWGDEAHEWAGAAMMILFIAHHILNRNWYKNLFKGRYSSVRILQLFVDMALMIVMFMQMYSGIVMSRHVFAFLPIESGLALSRKLHILGAYWGFVLMSVHLGLHWNMFLSMVKKKTGGAAARIQTGAGFPAQMKFYSRLKFIFGLAVAAYGIFVFIKRDFTVYMLLQSEFVFLDYDEPVWAFYLDHICLMGLWIFAAHYLSKGLKSRRR